MKHLFLISVIILIRILNLNAQTSEQNSYILAIEGEQIYLDLNKNNAQIGNSLNVIEKGGYFTHPVTGKKIKKKDKILAYLEISEVNDDYSIARAYPISSIKFLQKGMQAIALSKAESENYSSLRKSISVHPLKVTSATGGYLGIYISDLLTEKLFAQDKFKVIDRETLGLQIDEIALNEDGITNSNIQGIKSMAGVDYLITGTMHEPDVVEMSTGIPLKGALSLAESITGSNLGSKYVSDIKLKKLKAIVKLTLRIVDIRTGEIKFICTEMQQSEGKSDIALEQGFLGGLQVQGGSTAFLNTITGQAVQNALNNLSGYIDGYFDGRITDKSFKGNYIDAKKGDKKKKTKKSEFKFDYAIGDRIHFYDESSPGSNNYIDFREGKIIGLNQKRKQYQVKTDNENIVLVQNHLTFKYDSKAEYEKQVVKNKEFAPIAYHINDKVIGKVKNKIRMGKITYLLNEREQLQIQYKDSDDKEILKTNSFFPFTNEKNFILNPSKLKEGQSCLLFLHGTYYFAKVIQTMDAEGKLRVEYDFEDDGLVKSKIKTVLHKNLIGLKLI